MFQSLKGNPINCDELINSSAICSERQRIPFVPWFHLSHGVAQVDTYAPGGAGGRSGV